VAEVLRGKPGSAVKVEVVRPGDSTASRAFNLTRRAVAVPSVESRVLFSPEMEAPLVGYVRIDHFRDSTAQEVKDAVLALQAKGMQGLVLDLRGNPGGLFASGVAVAELFLNEGTIVYTQSPLPLRDFNKAYKVEAPGPFVFPVMVLVDGDTASAAEVVAGALKELRRAPTWLIGQTTFGKGSIQCLIPTNRPPLDKLPGGLRLTVARFFSPTNQPYHGRGVVPTYTEDVEGDAGLERARQKLLDVMQGMMMPGTMQPTMPPTSPATPPAQMS
jgi:carboxyl-terminal processing protease